MKYLKLFDAYNNEVKSELSKDERDDILDLFQAYIADKYQMVFFPHLKISNIPHPNDNDLECNYGVTYNNDNDKCFELLINISNKLNIKEFISDMKKFKERLTKFGFKVKGYYWKNYRSNNYQYQRTYDKKRYSVFVYKPMFTAKK